MNFKFRTIVTLLLALVLIFAVYNINEVEKQERDKEMNVLVNDLSQVTRRFSTWISTKKEMLNTSKDIINNFPYSAIQKDHILNPYLNINNDDQDVSQVYIGLADGRFVTGGEWVPPGDYDPRTRVWYQDASIAGETIISRVYTDRETGKQLVTLSSPLFIDEAFIGVISADVFLNHIHDYLAKQVQGSGQYAYLLDQAGNIIVHTSRPEWIGLNIFDDFDNQKILDYFNQVKKSDQLIEMEYQLEGRDIRGVTSQIDGANWYLGVVKTSPQVNPMIEQITSGQAIFNGLLILLILLLVFLLVKIKDELDQKNKALRRDNRLDFLTGIYNRRYFNYKMDKVWEAAKGLNDIGILMMDLDYFKEYNDYYGHVKGDEVLVQVAEAIQDLLDDSCVFARYGGEEFILLIKNTPVEQAEEWANRIQRHVYELNLAHEKSPYKRLTMSIGYLGLMPLKEDRIRKAINRADQALYEAKKQGRNTVRKG